MVNEQNALVAFVKSLKRRALIPARLEVVRKGYYQLHAFGAILRNAVAPFIGLIHALSASFGLVALN